MKANEFVKKHGLAEVKILLTSPSHGFFFKEDFYKHYGFDIYEDLKRLVESHEFINERGGLEHVKNLIATKLHWFDVDAIIKTNQAIFDVESCQ